ncbi:MAG: TRIC cation channel family protein [Opitutales bacterium]|nr:TRIC cation channel family protein [Opitutales bacterium]
MTTSAFFTLIIDYIGTFAFAISGIRRASAKQFDLFGAIVVGFATACGGGTLRDLLLGQTPFWMCSKDPFWTGGYTYLLVVLFALVVVTVLGRWLLRINDTIFIFDAIGLGLFTVVGIEKSLQFGFPIWVGILMGTVTGAGGGIFRDIFINVEPLVFRKDIYAMACIFGGFVYWIGWHFGLPSVLLQILTATAVIGLRCVSMKYHWTLPVLRRDVAEFDMNDLAPWRRYAAAGTVDDFAHFNLSVVACSLDDVETLNETDVAYVELATGMEEGGLTPSRVFIKAACEQSRAPVRVMVRPNSQGFVYTEEEFSRILNDIRYIRDETMAEGICLGILTRDNAIDFERMQLVMSQAGRLKVTFNRAFERTNQLEAYKQLETLGVDCVLVPFTPEIEKLPRAPITLRVAGGLSPKQLPALGKAGLTHIHMGRAVRKSLNYNSSIDPVKVWEFIHV